MGVSTANVGRPDKSTDRMVDGSDSQHTRGAIMFNPSNSQLLKIQAVSSTNWRAGVLAWLRQKLFPCCLVIIGAVSVYDTWLIFTYRDVIHDLERNEICRALINLEPQYVSCFVVGKTLGTLAVLISLTAIRQLNQKIAFTSATAVAAFQLGLLLYLTIADFDWCDVV
jgi:hypothetical protein